MLQARKGDLVQIHKIILEPNHRSDNLPDSTKSMPYEGWIKGFLMDESAKTGDAVKIETLIGRELTGTLCLVNPKYEHDFGEPQGEILSIGNEARKLIRQTRRVGKG